MRAAYIENLTLEDSYIIKGDVFHHLVNVVRVDAGDELLLLSGKGLAVKCLIESVSKRELLLKKLEHSVQKLSYHLDVVLGLPKKDAFDLCLKQLVELGVTKTYLVRSQYSQFKLPDSDRMNKVLVSALEQSNSPHLTELEETTFEEIDYTEYDHIVVLDSQNELANDDEFQGKILLIVGPEGGFSPTEFEFFNKIPNLVRVKLPTPIMRTPTALSCGVGIVLQRLMS